MRVRVNPEHLTADPAFKVHHPGTKRPFPSPDPFDLSEADAKNPHVLRLLPAHGQPGGVAGGVFGDLVLVAEVPEAPSKKKAS